MHFSDEMAVTADHRFCWSDSSCFWALEAASHVRPQPQPITSSHPLEFMFMSPFERPDWLEIRFATYARRNTPPVICELWLDEATLSGRVNLPPLSIQDGGYCRVADLRGLSVHSTKFRVRLTSPEAIDGNGFAAWVRNAPLRMHRWHKQWIRFRNDRFFLYEKQNARSDDVVLALPPERGAADATIEIVSRAFPGGSIRLIELARLLDRWEDIKGAAVLFLPDADYDNDILIFELHRRGVCTIFVDRYEAIPSIDMRAIGKTRRPPPRCRFMLSRNGQLTDNAPGRHRPLRNEPADLRALRELVSERRIPTIYVVARCRTPKERDELVASCERQSFPGPLVLLLLGVGNNHAAGLELDNDNRDFGPRFNKVLAARDVDQVIAILETRDQFVDRDLIVLHRGGSWATDFLAAHVLEHADDADAIVVGKIVVEATERAKYQEVHRDPIQDDGFLNCTTYNISFSRRLASLLRGFINALDCDNSEQQSRCELACGYSAYISGKAFRFNSDAIIKINIDNVAEIFENGATRKIDAFSDLQDFALVTRRWTGDVGHVPLLTRHRGPRALKILSYRWHAAHQYELHKLPHKFTLVTGVGENRFCDEWPYEQRPLRPNVELLPVDQIDPRDYDLAIVHFDENILATHLCNGDLDPSWGDPFAYLLTLSELPKIAVCHGTPPFVGQFAANPGSIEYFVEHTAEKRTLVDVIAAAKAKVVCNSRQALAEWGFEDARVIWHGFDPQQFPQGTYERGVLRLKADNRPHYRGAFETEAITSMLRGRVAVESLDYKFPSLEPRMSNGYANRSFRAYVDNVRKHSAYLNTTRRSPMPRSRGEAMMIGLVPITLRNHDVELFIENGQNGFYADSTAELADFIAFLFRDSDRPRRLGSAARRTALDVFNHDRFLSKWNSLIADVLGT